MGCVFSKQQWGKEKSSDAPKTREHSEDAEILSLAEIGKMGSHSFNERNFKENRFCNVCRQTADGNAVQCRECTTTAHIESEEKASGPCVASSDLPPSQSKMNIPATTDRVEIVMERLMDSQFDFDLTYITERIISVLYLPDLDDQRYSSNLNEVAAMLNSKHQDKFLLLNLSERRHDICRLNPKVEEFGWPDLHAPPLDKICGMCKTIENWLHSDPHNVVVLHCKGNKGKTGVVVAAYMHYSKISAGADQVLSTVAMRKFCEDKISTSSLQPSQNRYIYYFSGLLSSKIKMNSSPLVLHQILIPTLHNYQPEGDCTLFLKIYQSLKLVHSSSKFDFQGSSQRMCVNLEPALLLKGDILVKCYHWNAGSCKSECVFRVQFHTCSLHENQLVFVKRELDHACTDDRFPVDATVELLFSSKQRAEGEVQAIVQGLCSENGPADAIVRWDSYEHVNLHHEDSVEDISHTRGPLDGSLYAQVKKRRQTPGSSPKICPSPRRTTAHPPINCTSSLQPVSKSKDVGPSSASPCNSSGKKDKLEKDELRNRHRETAILDDGENSPVRPDPPQVFHSRPSSQTHSFCDPDVTKAQTLQPKHHTLPCSRTAPMMFRDMYASQTDVLWERAHCLKNPCQESSRHLYCSPPQAATNSPRPHAQTTRAQTLPPQMSLFYSGEACPLLHCSSHSQGYTHISSPPTNQQLLPRPYRELRYSSPPPTSCSCRDCFRLQEDVALHSLGRRELETLPWFREAEFGVRRDGPTNWRDGMETYREGMQESEYWRRRKLMSSLSSSHEHFHTISSPDPAMFPEYIPSISSFPSSQSSGYHSNHLPCPCSPQVIRESPGYPSISQSLSSSPIALITPSLKQANHSAECLNDGSNMPEKSQIGAFSTSTGNRPSEVGCQQKINVPEIEILLGSQSSVVSTINETEEILDDTSIKIKTSYPTSSNNSTRSSKDVESVMVQTEEPKRQSFPTSPSPKPPLCPSERSSASEFSHEFNLNESKNPLGDYNEGSSICDLSVSSPDLDGSVTPSFPIASSNYPLLTVPHVPYTGYTAVTIPASFPLPPLPEKHLSPPLQNGSNTSSLMIKSKPLNVSFSSITNELPLASSCKVMLSSGLDEPENHLSSTFVQDSSKYWYKPGISRDQAIAVLKDKEPGCFLIRDSNSFQGAYGLALKVSSLPAHSSNHGEVNNPQEQLVRHFLIESGAKGVKIKGCHNETYFGSLSALVYQHSITPVSLPCLLCIPDRDLVGELQESQSGTSTSTAAKLLRQGAACNVLYLNSVETESLTGPQAVAKATNRTLTQNPRPTPTVVHFKVSTQGITLTDNERRLFFRRHYPIHSVIFSCLDPMDQRWNDAGNASCKMFGFVARRSGRLGNVCHLFAELDSEQPATAIVNFINKVMLGPQQLRK